MPSFDVVSKLDWSEVNNALNQAKKEITQRFDFKGTDAAIERVDTGFVVTATSDDRVKAAYEVLRERLVRRKVSLKHFESKQPTPGPRGNSKLQVTVTEGIDADHAREIIKLVKASKLKVQAAIQQDTLRITGKKRDDLQAVIAELRKADLPIELQFNNFRD